MKSFSTVMNFTLILCALFLGPALCKPARTGKAFFAYFTSWSIYGRNFQPYSVPADQLSHVLYAFFRPNSDGTISITDSWADTDKHFPGDSWDEPGHNLYGNFKQLYKLKQKNRQFKVVMSVGGWTLSTNFPVIAASESTRRTFADNVVYWIENLGLDGVDIDWEYPRNEEEGYNFLLLMKEIRMRLTSYQASKNDKIPYLISCAMSCGPDKYELLPLNDLAKYVDYFLLMAYDFAGSWSNATGHQANLFGPAPSGQVTIDYFIEHGVASAQLVLGVPCYGRSFANTEKTIPSKFNGVGGGTWEQGVYDFKVLPTKDAEVTYDWNLVAATSYDKGSRELVSFDDSLVVAQKLKYVEKRGLAGAMIWELSGDKNFNTSSSIVNTISQWTGKELENSSNHLEYPKSIYDNLRKQMNFTVQTVKKHKMMRYA